MTLTFQEVSRILSIIDSAPEKDLDLTMDGLRVVVTSWCQNLQSVNSSVDLNQVVTVSAVKDPALSPLFHEIGAKQLGYFRVTPGLQVGSQVRHHDPIGTISVLGNATEVVEAPQDGWVSDICLNDGDFVEYGQTLVVLTTTRVDAGNSTDENPSYSSHRQKLD